jgi:hypothetical protein
MRRGVEQVVGRGELDASSASHVRYCSWPVVAVLEVNVAGQRQDVAAATAAPAATMVLPDVAAEMGGECLEKGVAGGLAKAYSTAGGRIWGGQGRTREDTRAVRADANLP